MGSSARYHHALNTLPTLNWAGEREGETTPTERFPGGASQRGGFSQKDRCPGGREKSTGSHGGQNNKRSNQEQGGKRQKLALQVPRSGSHFI